MACPGHPGGPTTMFIIVGLRDYHFFELVVSPCRAIELVFVSRERKHHFGKWWLMSRKISSFSPISRLSYLQTRLQPTSCRGSRGTWWNVGSTGWMMCWSRIHPLGSVGLLSKEGGSDNSYLLLPIRHQFLNFICLANPQNPLKVSNFQPVLSGMFGCLGLGSAFEESKPKSLRFFEFPFWGSFNKNPQKGRGNKKHLPFPPTPREEKTPRANFPTFEVWNLWQAVSHLPSRTSTTQGTGGTF